MKYPLSFVYELKENLVDLSNLESYLEDIILSIDKELSSNSISFNQSDNWRTRKNPNFMSKYTNDDQIFLIINGEVNKLTDTNYKSISMSLQIKIDESIVSNNDVNYLKNIAEYIVDNTFKKCVQQNLFALSYLKFLLSFVGELYKFIYTRIVYQKTHFINILNDYDKYKDDFDLLKNINFNDQYRSLGFLFGLVYEDNILNYNDVIVPLIKTIKNFIYVLDWEPIDFDSLEKRLFIISGFIKSCVNKLWVEMNQNTQQDLKCQLLTFSNLSNLPVKMKFEILDIDDIIDNSIKINIKKNIEKKTEYKNPISKQKKPQHFNHDTNSNNFKNSQTDQNNYTNSNQFKNKKKNKNYNK
jgi:hypothetical protein